ncbi:hypothetical protein LEP1GSC036_2378 [Leptospira weilii str. 2006001853]|uniref:Uncharacterized protein n=2 Tax=Leptospira weilii TaxID=28184 RepID=A0A828YW10_9LEPT|nr:hypothetical protein LEP1GSC036_2378 [Leptospira weilii str. 2006001853]EMN92124.1 hypothetical protein LEP1GSC108_3082 [Leptospira weilii str. UI 13098]
MEQAFQDIFSQPKVLTGQPVQIDRDCVWNSIVMHGTTMQNSAGFDQAKS